MPTLNANGIDLAYERHGDPTHPVVLLIQGLAAPLSAWPSRFIDCLVAQGFHVVRFDNRDMGQSQKIDDAGIPNIATLAIKNFLRIPVQSPYSLEDMMRDTDALLGELNIEQAHVVGASMGGMIAQLLAIHKPERVQSLISVMSTSGNRSLPKVRWRVSKQLMRRPKSSSRQDQVAFNMQTWRIIGSPAYPYSDDYLKDFTRAILERGIHRPGVARQMAAVLTAPSRVGDLARVSAPTLVIHGDADPLVRVESGIDTANAIPNAQLKIIPGMGHDLPPELIDEVVADIAQHIRHTSQDR